MGFEYSFRIREVLENLENTEKLMASPDSMQNNLFSIDETENSNVQTLTDKDKILSEKEILTESLPSFDKINEKEEKEIKKMAMMEEKSERILSLENEQSDKLVSLSIAELRALGTLLRESSVAEEKDILEDLRKKLETNVPPGGSLESTIQEPLTELLTDVQSSVKSLDDHKNRSLSDETDNNQKSTISDKSNISADKVTKGSDTSSNISSSIL